MKPKLTNVPKSHSTNGPGLEPNGKILPGRDRIKPLVLEPEHQYGWLDAGSLRLAIVGGSEPPSSENSRLSLQFEVKDLISEIAKLEHAGCLFFDKQLDTGEPYRMAQFRDPEGNPIALYELLE